MHCWDTHEMAHALDGAVSHFLRLLQAYNSPYNVKCSKILRILQINHRYMLKCVVWTVLSCVGYNSMPA
jgi:hypothetical protein